MKYALFSLALMIAAPAQAQNVVAPPWPDEEQTLAWMIEHLDIDPANVAAWNNNLVVEIDPTTLRRSGDMATAWFERDALTQQTMDDQGGHRSAVFLRQADCVQRRARTLAITAYTGHDRTGTMTSSDVAEDWQFDRPGTIGALQTSAACEGTRAVSDDVVLLWRILADQ